LKVKYEPKPLRNANQWIAFQGIQVCHPHPVVVNKFKDASVITCRDCFGFGHSAKKCPTGNKFDKFRMVNNLVRSLISRYRAKLALQIELVSKDSQLWAFEVSANADMTESAA
jgi:hypothetical protein